MQVRRARPVLFWTLLIAALSGAGEAIAAEMGQPVDWQLGFQTAATPVMENVHSFHNLVLVIITAIVIFVLALLLIVMVRFNARANPTPSRTTHNTAIEVAWTVIPVIILVIIAIPSFRLLFFDRTIPDADMTVKAAGNQWFWSYEYPDEDDLSFDSLLLDGEALEQRREVDPGAPRLLAVDNPVVVPVDTNVRLIVTANDVIHSWAIPSFGVKIDGIPGRLNEAWFRADAEGTYYGQCSELCGQGHAYMPIEVRVVSKDRYEAWLKEAASDGIEKATESLFAGVAGKDRRVAETATAAGAQ